MHKSLARYIYVRNWIGSYVVMANMYLLYNRMRQYFRKEGGKCNIWGSPAEFIRYVFLFCMSFVWTVPVLQFRLEILAYYCQAFVCDSLALNTNILPPFFHVLLPPPLSLGQVIRLVMDWSILHSYSAVDGGGNHAIWDTYLRLQDIYALHALCVVIFSIHHPSKHPNHYYMLFGWSTRASIIDLEKKTILKSFKMI